MISHNKKNCRLTKIANLHKTLKTIIFMLLFYLKSKNCYNIYLYNIYILTILWVSEHRVYPLIHSHTAQQDFTIRCRNTNQKQCYIKSMKFPSLHFNTNTQSVRNSETALKHRHNVLISVKMSFCQKESEKNICVYVSVQTQQQGVCACVYETVAG